MAFVLRAKKVDIDTGNETRVVLLRGRDAEIFGINPGDHLQLKIGRKVVIAVADITHDAIHHGDIGIFTDVWQQFRIKHGTPILVDILSRPDSIKAITKKLKGHEISDQEIYAIISDIVNHRLSTIETTYFVSTGYVKPYTTRELIGMIKAIAGTGITFSWPTKYVVDKHSVGGLAGNRTTMVAIPIVAAIGLTIPKTSSRAITSPSGTADTMETLAPVSLPADKVKQVVRTTGGCLIWGGGLSIAPADDIIIRVSRPLSLEPYDKMLVSILAKKVAMGVKFLIIDMPYGPGTKIPNLRVAKEITKKFIQLGRAFKMKVRVKYDPADQPIGQGIGPSLEARDVLRVLQQTTNRPLDLETKAIGLAGDLLEISGRYKSGQGRKLAIKVLKDGSAWRKMQQIIKAQGGNPHVTETMLMAGVKSHSIRAHATGQIAAIDNRAIDEIARALGAPDHRQAGIFLHRKIGQSVTRGEPLYTLFSHQRSRITLALSVLAHLKLYRIKP